MTNCNNYERCSRKRKVFVVNESHHDYSGAECFGDLVYLTTGNVPRYDVSYMYRTFHDILVNESAPEDYILLSGLSSMCSIACAMFAVRHGVLNLLIHSPKSQEYVYRGIDFSALREPVTHELASAS